MTCRLGGFTVDDGRIRGIEIREGKASVTLVASKDQTMTQLASAAATQLRELADEAERWAARGGAPVPGSVWKHTSGRAYTVLHVANCNADAGLRYPLTIVYRDADGDVWTRPADDWHRSMTPAP
jgi:hypothetical protein